VTLVIKKVDERKLREFKAEAIRRGLTLSQAFEEAIDLWLKNRVVETDVDINNREYLRIKDRLNKYMNKYVVIANGRFLGAFDTLKEVGNAIKSLKCVPSHAIVFKVGEDTKIRRRLEWWGGSIGLKNV